MYILQKFPPNLQYVATLPCESRKSKNVTDFDRTVVGQTASKLLTLTD